MYCVTATDDDFGYSGFVQYTIEPFTDSLDLFNIGLYDGCIRVLANLTSRVLDVETIKLNVRANDMGIPRKENSLEVLVAIQDVNNHKPVSYALSPSVYMP